ncbi:MAG: hypothetical protein JSV56_00365 [Methanomassiliicoccales archaeon]|nr:MAG: hypothetical protein JSV56_00365 [Methanomassiliicoccales archaeon]
MKGRALAMGTVLLLLLFSSFAQGDDYISDPSRIPLIDNIDSPDLEPGDSGTFSMTIENRYHANMENITLIVEIYASATYYSYDEIADVEHPPSINGQGITHSFNFQEIENDTSVYVNFTVKSSHDTTQGTYFLRFQLEFEYNNTAYIMKSRGYFSDEEWEEATSKANETHPGRIDIEILEVDGILPDSSVRVWAPIPIWPLYVCVMPLIVLLGFLALLFYCQEEYNMFPWLDQGFKYWSSKFHQSWRLLKHRFRKA